MSSQGRKKIILMMISSRLHNISFNEGAGNRSLWAFGAIVSENTAI
jgi:hypothetical protein